MIEEQLLINNIFKWVLSKNLNFVVYKLPDSKVIKLIIDDQNALSKIDSIKEIPLDKNSFVFAPFIISKTNPIMVLDSKNEVNSAEIDHNYFTDLKKRYGHHADMPYRSEQVTERKISVYEQSFRSLKREKIWHKVVLSHYQLFDLEHVSDLCDRFYRLNESFDNTFNYLLKLDNEIWLGASPENLLSLNENEIRLTALAGTQKAKSKILPEDHQWPEKDINEHNFVVDYLQKMIKNYDHIRSATKTVFNRNLAHLNTTFKIKRTEGNNIDINKLLQQLHPTPAVAGIPKEVAISFINKFEKYNRSYYTGFIGPVAKDNIDLFVNLRCAKLFSGKICFYAGGGIVQESEYDKELNEIKLKINNLKNIFLESEKI